MLHPSAVIDAKCRWTIGEQPIGGLDAPSPSLERTDRPDRRDPAWSRRDAWEAAEPGVSEAARRDELEPRRVIGAARRDASATLSDRLAKTARP
jgi:hypothetical protein